MKKSLASALFISVFSFCIPNAALASEKPIIYAQSGNSSPLHYIIFSKDSKYLTSFSFDKAIVWEVASGRSYGEFHIDAAVPSALVNSLGFKTFKEGSGLAGSRQAGTDSGRVVYSDDTALVAEIPNTNAAAILIKEAKSGTVLKELGFIRDSIRRISVSEDQTTLYCGSGFSDLAIWDTAGFLKRKVSTASLLEDNRSLLEAGYETVKKFFSKERRGVFTITDTFTGRTMKIPADQLPERSRLFGLSPRMDKVLVAVFGEKRVYQVLDAATLKPLRTFAPESPHSLGWQMGGFAFSPDGTHIALLAEEIDGKEQKRRDVVCVYHLPSGERISRLSVPDGPLYGFQYTPSGDGMFMAEADKIHLMNMRNGAILDTYTMGDEKAPWRASLGSNIYVCSETEWLAMGDAGGMVHLWDVESGKKLKTFPENGDGTSFVLFTPDKKRMWTTGTDDGTVRLTDVVTGRQIASFISFRDGEWAVIIPEGYYNASPDGEKYLNVRVGSTIHGIEKFREMFFRPDLVKFALQGGSLAQFGSKN